MKYDYQNKLITIVFSKTQDKSILIGRLVDEHSVRLLTSSNDRTISRVHAEIDCIEGFEEFQVDRLSYFEFLKGTCAHRGNLIFLVY